MPVIYKYLGYYFRFYSNEHEPIHVHVQANGRESIMELIMNNNQLQKVNVRPKRGAEPLNAKELAIAREFVEKYYPNIIEKWIRYFVRKQNVRTTVITKKI